MLLCSLIHPTHSASVFFNTDDFMFLRKLVWLMRTLSALVDLGYRQDASEEDVRGLEAVSYGHGIEYSSWKTEIAVPSVIYYFKWFCWQNTAPSSTFTEPDAQHTFPAESFSDLHRFVMDTFLGEEVLHDESSRIL